MVMLYEVMLRLHYGLVMVMLWLLLRAAVLARRQENVSAVPTASHIFFQPLHSRLAYSGLKEQRAQCEQQDRQDEKQYRFTKSRIQLHN